MEQKNLPIVAKKFWKIVRVMYFMLRKGISKGKLLADLSMHMMMKRGKIASKHAIQNLMFHHTHRIAAVSTSGRKVVHDVERQDFEFPVPLEDEYEFSCTNSPATSKSPSNTNNFFQLIPLFKFNKRKHHVPAPKIDMELMAVALEMANSVAGSPALPGFGPSPMVRQLRITDSPFPLGNGEDDSHVDEAAEEFIMKFYNDLKRQNAMSSS